MSEGGDPPAAAGTLDAGAEKWHEVPPVGPRDEGSVGGDIQAGTAWGRRFARRLASGLWAVIDDVFYTVIDTSRSDWVEGDTEPNDLQNQTTLTVCRDLDDVGGSEVFTEMQYEWIDASPPTDATARTLCARLQVEHYGWRPEDHGY